MAIKENKGKPAGQGKNKSPVKEERSKKVMDREREEIYQEKYADEEGEEPAENVRKMNPNRNPEKGRRD